MSLTESLWRLSPALRNLPDALARRGVKVYAGPFEKLAQHLEEREDYLWRELIKYREGAGSNNCKIERYKVRNSAVARFRCVGSDGGPGAALLRDAATALFEALTDTQRLWLERYADSLLFGLEVTDAAVRRGWALLNTTDLLVAMLYATAKHASRKKITNLYLSALDLTTEGARPMLSITAEANAALSKRNLYEAAERGDHVPHLEKYRNPATWLGLILGDGTVRRRAVDISTKTPALIRQLIPYTASAYHSYKLTLRRFVVDIIVRHAEPIIPLLDALAETLKPAKPPEHKWIKLRKIATRPLNVKTITELYINGLHDLIGEVRLQEPDFVVFRRPEDNIMVYIYLVKDSGQWYATQARFRNKGGRWIAKLYTKNLEVAEKLKTKLALRASIRTHKDKYYVMKLDSSAMI